MFHISRDKWKEDPRTAVLDVYTGSMENNVTISLVGNPGRHQNGKATLSCVLSVDDAKELRDQLASYLSRKTKKSDQRYGRFRAVERD